MKLIPVGYQNFINSNRIVSMCVPESAPVKRIVTEAKQQGLIVDVSCGRKTRTVFVMDTGHIILSAVRCATFANRMGIDDSILVEEIDD